MIDKQTIKSGDRVTLLSSISCTQMFYGPDEEPKEEVYHTGDLGTVVTAWESGSGIVEMDKGKKIMVMDLKSRFDIKEEPTC